MKSWYQSCHQKIAGQKGFKFAFTVRSTQLPMADRLTMKLPLKQEFDITRSLDTCSMPASTYQMCMTSSDLQLI